jgi:hypothetical protein
LGSDSSVTEQPAASPDAFDVVVELEDGSCSAMEASGKGCFASGFINKSMEASVELVGWENNAWRMIVLLDAGSV